VSIARRGECVKFKATGFFALGACGSDVEALYYIRSLASGLEFETDMRWFVEVSRVGENGVADEYCVEAKQWQAALQEARKLRGDTGALSKFSIELLDRGYRAVDPSLKLRYLINEAPADAPLTEESSRKNGNQVELASGKPRIAESLAPSAYATSLAPTPFTTSLAPPPSSTSTSNPVPRPTSHAASRPNSVAPARAVSVEPPRTSQLVVPDDPVPPAPPLPGSSSLPSPLLAPRVPLFELVRQRAEEPRPDSPITYREFAYAVEPGRTRDEVEALLRDRYQATLATLVDRPPGKFVQLAVFDHVFKRRPERPPLATFAWKDWRGEPVLAFPGFGEAAMAPMSQVPPARESVAPPSNGAATSVPPPAAPESMRVVPMAPVVIASVPPPAQALVVEAAPAAAAEVEIPIVEAAPAATAEVEIPIVEAAPVPLREVEIPIEEAAPVPLREVEIPIEEAEPVQAVATASAVAPVVGAAQAQSPIALDPPQAEVPVALVAGAPALEAPIPSPSVAPPPAIEVRVPIASGAPTPVPEASAVVAPPVEMSVSMAGARAPLVEAPLVVAGAPAPSFELNFESAPSPTASPAPSNPTSAERGSRPRIAAEGRRRAGEDLIGELFEIMHELNFAHDVAEGSEFVLSVLNELLPCEGVLIHVFDINTSHFVVVRAKGPNANAVLLQRLSDQDPWVRSVMRSTHATSVKNAAEDARFTGSRWQALGVAPRAALCGGVQLSGRYLGLIEVANPHGDVPFHRSELNALDYICEQFAAFLSKKPIVLSADVVLSRV
jgi:hypothetical protein